MKAITTAATTNNTTITDAAAATATVNSHKSGIVKKTEYPLFLALNLSCMMCLKLFIGSCEMRQLLREEPKL